MFICDNNKDEVVRWGLETDVSRNVTGRNRELATLDHSENSALKAREFKTRGTVGVVLNVNLPVSDTFGSYLKPLIGRAFNSILNLFLLPWLRRATAGLKQNTQLVSNLSSIIY